MDLYQRQGGYPVPPGASSILGVEFSGSVAELGEGVTRWAVGDEVFGLAGGVSRQAPSQSLCLLLTNGMVRELMRSS